MRKTILGVWLAVVLGAVAACGGENKVYECPMHCVPPGSNTEVTANEPGKCPVCGMDLVERR
jgi:transcription initiation factor IIE alpha subunit